MHFYSIHVIAEFNLSGSEIICRQIVVLKIISQTYFFPFFPLKLSSTTCFKGGIQLYSILQNQSSINQSLSLLFRSQVSLTVLFTFQIVVSVQMDSNNISNGFISIKMAFKS